jgi:hypothetical protein
LLVGSGGDMLLDINGRFGERYESCGFKEGVDVGEKFEIFDREKKTTRTVLLYIHLSSLQAFTVFIMSLDKYVQSPPPTLPQKT